MNERIYLDNNATTCLDLLVVERLQSMLAESWGNPSSIHQEGQKARAIIDQSRRSIADFIGVRPKEIVFTSGATEGLNLVIRGILGDNTKGHVISSGVEHPAVYSTLKCYERRGLEITFAPVGRFGAVTPEQLRSAIRPDTRLIALMAVNNETGVKTDIEGVAAVAEEAGIPLVVDGVALLGKETFSIPSGVSAMAFSAHKLHGPKGIGFVFLRKRLKLEPVLTGGGHEQQRRAGTENLMGIVGFAAAVEAVQVVLPHASEQMGSLRDRFEEGLRAEFPIQVNGEGPRVANTSNLCFPGVSGESLLMNLDLAGVAASHGSACSSGALEPSRVLMNMGLSTDEAASSLRFSLSRLTSPEEVDRAVAIILKLLHQLRA